MLASKIGNLWLELAEKAIDTYEPCLADDEKHLEDYFGNVSFDVAKVAAKAKLLFAEEKCWTGFDREETREAALLSCRRVVDDAETKAAWEAYEEAREEEFQRCQAIENRVIEVYQAVESALGCNFLGSMFGSRYADYRGLKLRVSDHKQVAGGGWREERQERSGESDVQWVVEDASTPLPSAAEIRRQVAKKLWENRFIY